MDRNREGRELLPDHQWVFINPKCYGKRLERITKSFYEARDKAGLPQMTLHTLR
jgi:hypothetical protein